MYINLQGHKTFVSTGGRNFDPKGRVLLFIHGSGQSHLSWMLQSRFFANRDFQVLAPDLPGHYLSEGDALETIEEQADWCAELLNALEVSSATIIGHSQGGLICLELARRHPAKVAKMAIISSAMAIPVNDALIDLAANAEPKAAKAMVSWSHATEGHKFDHSMPGQNHLGYGREVMAQNPGGVLLTDLTSCNNYQDGAQAAQEITCPSICILAERDKMVPKKFGLKLAEQLADCQVEVIAGAGHFVQSEKSFQTNNALRPFLD
ncbi:MAG: alpha/beta hydrolase [Alphaproteobacteria bacterium]|nr:alpha/beta hydrolase [Alphaproteobacteria bacterium]